MRPFVVFAILGASVETYMSANYNEYVLSTAYHSGWITAEQYTAAATALQAMPHLSAIDFLHEQAIITPEQAKALHHAIAQSTSSVEGAAVQVDGAVNQSRVQVNQNALPSGLGIADLLRLGVEAGASDVHLGVSSPALMRLHGTLRPLYHDAPVLSSENTEALIHSFLNSIQLDTLEKERGL
ncbi:MAG TPA: hypothetical protein VGC39_07895, partial [Candidatus Methylacidiphilales bacterium]